MTPPHLPGPTTPAPASPAPAGAAQRPLLLRLLDLPVHLTWLDAVAGPLRDVVHAAEPRWLADLLHGSWLGHPLHPVLAQATVGSWTSAGVLDALTLLGVVPEPLVPGVEAASATLVATGLGTAGPTFATGWTDWSDLHPEQQRLGLVHAAGTYTATAMFAVSLYQRAHGRRTSGRWWSVGAVSAATVGAALGGHLAYRWSAGANHAEEVPHRAPGGWYRVATWDELPGDAPQQCWVGDVPVVVVRTQEGVSVLADTCTHLGASLAGGDVESVGGVACLTCPWHGSVFRIADGAVVHGPATAPQPVFEARVTADGDVLARVVALPGVPPLPPLPTAVER